jgi:hypothetical protein
VAGLLFITLALPAKAETVAVTIDCNQFQFPPLTLTRGSVDFFENDSDGMRDQLDYGGTARMGLVNGIRNLNEDKTGKAESNCGSPLPEFYRVGTNILTRQDANWTNLRNRANQNRLLIIHQLQQTPAEAGTPLFILDPAYWFASDDKNPIPIPAEFDLYGSVLGDWIKNSEIADGYDYPAIWCGPQEPDHTLGYIDGIETEAGKILNVERMAHLWTPVARQIRADNRDTFVAGIQQNASRGNNYPIDGNYYLHGVNYFMQYERILGGLSPFDFLFIQNYQAENNVPVIANARFSLSSAESGMPFGHPDVAARFQRTPIVFNRYNFDKTLTNNYTTAEGVTRLLKYETYMLDAPDLFGYAVLSANYFQSNMAAQVAAFMNKMPRQRRPVTISQTAVYGFAGVNELGAYVVLANGSDTTSYDATLDLASLMPAGADDWSGYTLEVKKGEGSVYGVQSGVSLSPTGPDDFRITGLTLGPETFATIRLDADGVSGLNRYSQYLDRFGLDQLAYTRFEVYCDRQVNSSATPLGQGRYNPRTGTLCVSAQTSAGVGLAGVVFRKVPANRFVNLDFLLEQLPVAGDGSTVLEARIDYLDGDTIMKSACISPNGFLHAGSSFWNSLAWRPISAPQESSQEIADDRRMTWDIDGNAPSGWSDVTAVDRGIMISLLLNNVPNPAMVQVDISDVVPPSSVPVTLAFNAVADATCRQGSPNSNLGGLNSLQVRGDASAVGMKFYTRFDVTGIKGPIHSAVMKVKVQDKTPANATAWAVASTSWDEMTVTWNTAPPIGTSLSTIAGIPAFSWVGWDVTGAVTEDGLYSFAVTSTDDRTALFFDSRESANIPVLEVTYLSTPANSAPAFNSDPFAKADAMEARAYSNSIAGDVSDVDDGDTLSFSKISGATWLQVETNGVLSGVPGIGDVGTNAFVIRVTDAGGLYDEATLNITVIGTSPPHMDYVMTGTNLFLTWPATPNGWILESKTNLLIGDWVEIPGSQSNTSMAVPLIPTAPAEFYRLRYPHPF